MLKKVQEFDPIGVGARSLAECLLIQARHIGADDDLVVEIIKRHLANLEKKNYQAIARDLGQPLEEIYEAAKVIKEFDPKPGRQYTSDEPNYITPDVYVHKVGDKYFVVANDDGLPKLKISDFYRSALTGGPKARDYIQDKLRTAQWLIRSIQQRQRTIIRVTESILKFQREFFDKGIAHLKPLILRDVAEDIGMHESTVSRVTTNKYVHTPQGIYELKFFFNSGISRTDGEDLASEAVKPKIKQIIGSESPKNPHSDQQIVELLKDQNIDIARRTVAKYREQLRHPLQLEAPPGFLSFTAAGSLPLALRSSPPRSARRSRAALAGAARRPVEVSARAADGGAEVRDRRRCGIEDLPAVPSGGCAESRESDAERLRFNSCCSTVKWGKTPRGTGAPDAALDHVSSHGWFAGRAGVHGRAGSTRSRSTSTRGPSRRTRPFRSNAGSTTASTSPSRSPTGLPSTPRRRPRTCTPRSIWRRRGSSARCASGKRRSAITSPTAAPTGTVRELVIPAEEIEPRSSPSEASAPAAAAVPTGGYRIIKDERVTARSMTVEDAVMQMNLLGDEHLIFTDAATGTTSVLYRRRDGNYGLIATAPATPTPGGKAKR